MFLESWLVTVGLGYLFVALVIAIVLVLGLGRSRRRSGPRAEQILRRRYAAGELTREELEGGLRTLSRQEPRRMQQEEHDDS